MLVKDYMTRHPLLAEPSMSLVEAQRYMGENQVRHLPVVGDGRRLLGLVTRQSLLIDPRRLASVDVWDIARALSGVTVKDVMVKAKDVVTVAPDLTIEEAASLLVDHKIGCLPVVEGAPPGFVVGIITERDLLAQMAEMMGTRRPGVRVTVRMPDRKGELAKLVHAINAQGWGIMTLGGASAPRGRPRDRMGDHGGATTGDLEQRHTEPDKWDAVVKIQDVSRDQVVAALGQVKDQVIVDVREA